MALPSPGPVYEALAEATVIFAVVVAVLTVAVVSIEKPDPRIFELALTACGVGPEAAVHVGDSRRTDVAGGWRPGSGRYTCTRSTCVRTARTSTSAPCAR